MSVPGVSIQILDNQLGLKPDSTNQVPVFMGCSSLGTALKPAKYSRVEDLHAAFGEGDAVEAAAYTLENTGKPIIFIKIEPSVDGYIDYLDASGVTGSSVPEIDPASDPWDDYEGYIIVIAGGTIGTPGIKIRWSLDGGRTLSPVTALGSNNYFVFPNSGVHGCQVDFNAGDLNAGDVITFRTDAPKWDTQGISDAFDALAKSALQWHYVYLVGPCDVSEATVFSTELEALVVLNKAKYRWGMVNTRKVAIGETEAEYYDAMSTDFANFSSKRTSVGYGWAKTLSSIRRAFYRRPIAFGVIGRATDISISTDLGEVERGPLPGIQIADSAGNPDDHDEAIYPGADDARFTTLRSFDAFPGVYVNNGNLFSPPGSDFKFIQHRRVIDTTCDIARYTLNLRIGKSVRVDRVTGFILTQDKLEIESAVNAALRNQLIGLGHVSDAYFILNSQDNINADSTLRGKLRVLPLGYIKFIEVTIAFVNPANSIVSV